MDKLPILVILISLGIVALLAGLAYVLIGGGGSGGKVAGMKGLMSGQLRTQDGAARKPMKGEIDPYDLDAETLRKQAKRASGKKTEDIAHKLFRAGMFAPEDKTWFGRIQIFSAIVVGPIFPALIYLVAPTPMLLMIFLVLGMFIGYAAPITWLERKIRAREDDTMYYLPLVIEQISIGVSSALDIGPCVSHIVHMANERDSHNPVTEMFVHVEKLMRSGLNLEDSLVEVSEANGLMEVKHAFMFLGQCSKHGGELSKQLQELADTVMTQRQVQVEGKITALPVKATGPLAMVFAGFFGLLMAGLFVKLLTAFQ